MPPHAPNIALILGRVQADLNGLEHSSHTSISHGAAELNESGYKVCIYSVPRLLWKPSASTSAEQVKEAGDVSAMNNPRPCHARTTVVDRCKGSHMRDSLHAQTQGGGSRLLPKRSHCQCALAGHMVKRNSQRKRRNVCLNLKL